MTNTPSSAALLQALLFLGTTALVVVSFLVAVGGLAARRARITALALTIGGSAIAAYALLLVAFGALGRDRVLGPGEAKVFCELDCHLAYTVPRVRTATTVGDVRAQGVFFLVTVRTTFDASTTAPWRGDGALYPNPRRVRLVDSVGGTWRIDDAAQRALGTNTGTPISTPLRPGESYESTFVFDVPRSIEGARLELTEDDAITRVMVGHENSPFHGKTVFALGRGDFGVRR